MQERPFNKNTKNAVCQMNDLVMSSQNLNVNALKVIRAAIMQIQPEDDAPMRYQISIRELAELLQVRPNNLYRSKNGIEDIVRNISDNPVIFRKEQIRRGNLRIKEVRIPWVNYIQYDSGKGIQLELNPQLSPLLINLQAQYTQYQLMDIMDMRSAYGIRLYEILRCMLMNNLSEPRTLNIKLSELRECLSYEDTNLEYKHFKSRVLEKAVEAINNNAVKVIHVTYSEIKKGNKVDEICFHVTHPYDLR